MTKIRNIVQETLNYNIEVMDEYNRHYSTLAKLNDNLDDDVRNIDKTMIAYINEKRIALRHPDDIRKHITIDDLFFELVHGIISTRGGLHYHIAPCARKRIVIWLSTFQSISLLACLLHVGPE